MSAGVVRVELSASEMEVALLSEAALRLGMTTTLLPNNILICRSRSGEMVFRGTGADTVSLCAGKFGRNPIAVKRLVELSGIQTESSLRVNIASARRYKSLKERARFPLVLQRISKGEARGERLIAATSADLDSLRDRFCKGRSRVLVDVDFLAGRTWCRVLIISNRVMGVVRMDPMLGKWKLVSEPESHEICAIALKVLRSLPGADCGAVDIYIRGGNEVEISFSGVSLAPSFIQFSELLEGVDIHSEFIRLQSRHWSVGDIEPLHGGVSAKVTVRGIFDAEFAEWVGSSSRELGLELKAVLSSESESGRFDFLVKGEISLLSHFAALCRRDRGTNEGAFSVEIAPED